jgi:hypothetical protein
MEIVCYGGQFVEYEIDPARRPHPLNDIVEKARETDQN